MNSEHIGDEAGRAEDVAGMPHVTQTLDAALALIPQGYILGSLRQRTRYEIADAAETSCDPDDQQEWTALVHIQTEQRTFRIGRRYFHHGVGNTPVSALVDAATKAQTQAAALSTPFQEPPSPTPT